jgi:hypothetical protein
MSVEQIEQSVLQLSAEERRQFAQWFYEHEDELAEPQTDDDKIHPEVRAELERRLKEIDEHPELLEPWEGTTDRIRARLHDQHRQKNVIR